MKRGHGRWSRRVVFVLLAFLALVVAGCEPRPGKTRIIESDWSRGKWLGIANLRDPSAIAVDPAGGAVHLAWPQKGEDGIVIHYMQMDRDARTVVDHTLDADLFYPRTLQIMLGTDGRPLLFAQARPESGEHQRIFLIRLDERGDPVGQPMALTPPEHDVEHFDVGMRDGQILLIWHSAHAGGQGIYFAISDTAGQAITPAAMVAASGLEPALSVDADGVTHLIWVMEPRYKERFIYFASMAAASTTPSEATMVATYSGGTGTIFSPPLLAHDAHLVYIFWPVEYRSGLEQGSASTFYIAFPKGQPSEIPHQKVSLPGDGNLVYVERERALGYRKLFPIPSEGVRGSSYVANPIPIDSQVDELAVMFGVSTAYRMDENIQPGMAIFSAGTLVGYQLVARTDNLSWYPVGATDEDGYLYVTWSDTAGQGNYDVYLASTAPALKAGINRLTLNDIAFGVIDVGWGMLSGLTLTPLAIITLVLPLLWVAAYYIVRGEDDLSYWGPRAALIIAVVLYYGMKLVLFSTVIAFPPLLQVVPHPLSPLVKYGLPALILLLAVGGFRLYTCRAELPRLFTGFFVFAITDAVLTMLLYGPGFFD